MAHDLFDFLFGGTDTTALDAQTLSNQRAQELIREQANLARADVLGIFPAAQQAQQQGFQAAANLFGESIPEQARLFSLGNVEAQRAQTQGLAGFRESILGLPQDFSQDFLQQGIQQFTPSFGFTGRDISIPTAPSIDSLGLNRGGLPEIPSFFTGIPRGGEAGFAGGEGLEDPVLTTPQTEQGIAEIGPLINQLLSQTELPLLDRANTVFDEADRLGLSVQQLAENSNLTVEEILIGLEQTGRTLPGAPFRPPSNVDPVPTFRGTQNQSPEFLASQRISGGGF